jgi:hypothetical protein
MRIDGMFAVSALAKAAAMTVKETGPEPAVMALRATAQVAS